MLPRWWRASYVFMTAVLILLIAEAGLRLAAALSPRAHHLLTPNWARGAEPPSADGPVLRDDVLGCRGNPAFPEHDADGFRNRGSTAHVEVVALGDSQTYGSMVAPDEAWPAVLASIGRVSVRNLGFGAWGPWEYTQTLDRALSLRPSIVFVGVYVANDLYDAYRAAYVTRRAKPWFDPSRAAIFAALDEAGSPDDAGAVLFASTASNHAQDAESLRAWFSLRVRLYGLARALKDELTHAEQPGIIAGLDTHDWTAILDWAKRRPDWCTPFERDGLRTVFTPKYRRQALDLDDPRVVEGARLTVAALTGMAGRCRDAGVRFRVLLIPTKETVFAPHVPAASRDAEYTRLLVAEERALTELRISLNAADIEVVDVLDALREVFDRGAQPYAISADGHPNAAGHRALAAQVAAGLAAD